MKPAMIARVCGVAVLLAVMAQARGASVTVYPDYASAPAVGVFGDAPTSGFASGSWQANGVSKSQLYIPPEALFGGDVALSDITNITYYTKKDTDHVTDPPDWYLHIYTKPYADSPGSTWYGNRLNSEPYFSENLQETPAQWTFWVSETVGTPQNRLRWFDSSSGYLGSYTDPFWNHFRTDSAYADQEVLYFSVATGSGWASGFTGQVDGLTVSLANGETGSVNFEPVPEPLTVLGVLAGVAGIGGYIRRRRREA